MKDMHAKLRSRPGHALDPPLFENERPRTPGHHPGNCGDNKKTLGD